ncbi:WhiB family transcriptional regulator [Streptosporangium sp. NPDC000239]|uniref:WhiB family transcriptional regulator n=1 Tax=Streptosporangium sp. NPDC000239 TaxID=3154248 RepID=UPI003329BC6C
MTAAFSLAVPDNWALRAACVGKALLMAKGPQDLAKRVCRSCPVLRECRTWVQSLTPADDPGGVCGGLTEKERTGQGRDDDEGTPCIRDCKCVRCRERKARNRRARKAARLADPSLIAHGTVSGYSEYNCRCALCLPMGERVNASHRRSDRKARAGAS